MKIYDISLPIYPGMAVWPGDPSVEIRTLSSIAHGDHANVSQICMSVHTGTHIDAPNHFLDDSTTIDKIPMDKLMGEVFVMDLGSGTQVIDEDVLKSHPKSNDLKSHKKVLFKTKNSLIWDTNDGNFYKDYVGINSSGAMYLANLNLELVGVDYLSVANFSDTQNPHKILLNKKMVLLEGINLQNVPQGVYELYCLPLLIADCEGAPARTILISQDDD